MIWGHLDKSKSKILYKKGRDLPINSCPLSCRRAWPLGEASKKRRGSWSTCNDASFTFRSARMWCHCLSFRGTWDFTVRTSGPFPTLKENVTVDGAEEAEPKVTVGRGQLCYSNSSLINTNHYTWTGTSMKGHWDLGPGRFIQLASFDPQTWFFFILLNTKFGKKGLQILSRMQKSHCMNSFLPETIR